MARPNTWMLVANGLIASVLAARPSEDDGEAGWVPVAGGSFRCSPARGETGQTEDYFMDILAWLVAPSNMAQFDQLIIVAPAAMLEELHAQMPRKLNAKIAREVSADLAGALDAARASRMADQLRQEAPRGSSSASRALLRSRVA
jgi:hypothetical protein